MMNIPGEAGTGILELKVAHVTPSFGIIPDNLKTCIPCFELIDGADMMNIPDEARTGILELKVAHVHPSFGIISDNLKTCIRCFELSVVRI